MSIVLKFERLMEKLCVFIGCLGMALITVFISIQVFYRFIMNASLPWPEEISLYIEVWMVFVVGGYCVGKRQHISMDLLTSSIPYTARFVLEKVTTAVCLGFSIFMIIYSYKFCVAEKSQLMSAFPLPKWWVYLAMLAGAIIMTIYCVLLLLEPKKESTGEIEQMGETN